MLAVVVLTGWWPLLAVQALLFAATVALGPGRGPWGLVFRALVRPRLSSPAWWEDAAAPRFAQGVGRAVVGAGLLLALIRPSGPAKVYVFRMVGIMLLSGGVVLGISAWFTWGWSTTL